MKALALCLPRYGAPVAEHDECVDALIDAAQGRYHVGRAFGTGPNVDIVRAQIAKHAAPAELWLWLDSDMVFDPEEVLRMVAEAEMREAVVAGLYVSKARGGALQAWPEATSITCFEGGGLVPARAFGFGCVAMRSELYTRIAERLGVREVEAGGVQVHPLFQPVVTDRAYHSDDYSFCLRARKAGVPLFVDTRPRLGHVGRYTFYPDDLGAAERVASLTLELGDRS